MRLFLLLGLLLTASALSAQTCADPLRYKSAIFPTAATTDIVYGNAQAIPLVYVNENVTVAQDLTMDIWQPLNDTVSQRPLLIMAFGGGFIIGSKEDADVTAVCDSFARKGFVTASINYRKGLDITNDDSAERAVYRATQDWSAAIRWFREYPDSFRIHPDHIYIGGVSAGGFGALHAQYTTDADRPASTFAQGLPFARPDLGCIDCSGNSFNHSRKAKALINLWGAIGDTNWVENSDSVPLLAFHGTDDLIVPYGYGFPFTAIITLPQVYGSSLIAERAANIGLQHQFVSFQGVGHNIWGTVVNNAWGPNSPSQYQEGILTDMRDFLWPFLKPVTDPVSGDVTPQLFVPTTYSVPFRPGYRWCWDAGPDGVVQAVPNQPNMVTVTWTAAGQRQVVARPVNEVEALGEPDSLQVNVLAVSREEESFPGQVKVYPQPSEDALHVYKDFPQAMDWRLLGMRGEVVDKGKWRGNELVVEGLAAGLYLIECRLGDALWSQKVLVR